MSQEQEVSHPAHLEPSELGTKEYWDNYYQNGLDNEEDSNGAEDDDDDDDEDLPPHLLQLESWFDDVGAPTKTSEFLTSTSFPLSPNYVSTKDEGGKSTSSELGHDLRIIEERPTVLDLGTGNGSVLFALRIEGQYTGRMVGVDYSSQSIELARKLARQYLPSASISTSNSNSMTDSNASSSEITFEVLDIIHDDPTVQAWWPKTTASIAAGSEEGPCAGFDLVLDKGTFDAISLSSSIVTDATTDRTQRICELYPAKVLAMVKPGGFFLVTSCNWTEEEVVTWFTGISTVADHAVGAGASANASESESENAEGIEIKGKSRGKGRFEVYDRIKYPVFEFGGHKGQGVASVCFKKVW
ncbi:uncharacterized protein Z518_01549 [Rhinocladiella mackenziei CBS 650.93]|uniref:Protein-lysine N-methyltransferase EFM4 n=1 Tax=Rhinocladiella mackenziei CBS 650.93 TaxID=1442369 RepID=A0A0D2J438_9EURO|nr:uncharacterized protein Z518_01549 [Rhinocladiella mackenziei CBS 650.93]KIX10466.1 hypothetical protein Z518_01549 [Rhinocladiella mackenziei CBS 650.93]